SVSGTSRVRVGHVSMMESAPRSHVWTMEPLRAWVHEVGLAGGMSDGAWVARRVRGPL
ncbi:hypothetical protein NDU88_000235, partial [Pleurodeles waltl]